MSYFLKDPDSVLDYGFDWSSWLQTGETISDHTITAATGITVDSSSVNGDGDKVVVWLSSGTSGEEYSVICHIVTSDGREDDRTIYIQVQER